jgi:predicted transcriptional regulator
MVMSEVKFKTDGLAGFKERVLKHARALDRSESLPSETTVSFSSIHEMFRILTPKRVVLLERLAQHGSRPVNLLAQDVHRTRKSVLRDIVVLRRIGAVDTAFVNEHGKPRTFIARPLAGRYEFNCSISPGTRLPAPRLFAAK